MQPHGIVCAHRGASLQLPDNSVRAFAAAIASGCEAIETDVRMRSDGTLVLAHDTWDVDVPDVVELRTLLDLAHGRVGLDLEIVEPGLERALLDEVDGFDGWLLVTSIYPEVIVEVGTLVPALLTGLVVESPLSGGPAGDPFDLADACGARVTLVEDDLATPALIARAADQNRPLWVYTVNEVDRMRQLLADRAVTGLISDDPALACRVRAEAGVQFLDAPDRRGPG